MSSTRPALELAGALQDCLDDAVERGATRAAEKIEPRLDKRDATIREMREHMDGRFDRQDDSLRLMWKRMKGNGKLPIDD